MEEEEKRKNSWFSASLHQQQQQQVTYFPLFSNSSETEQYITNIFHTQRKKTETKHYLGSRFYNNTVQFPCQHKILTAYSGSKSINVSGNNTVNSN